MGYFLFFPGYRHGLTHQRRPQPSNIPGHSPKISDRRSDERPFGHGDPTQKYAEEEKTLCRKAIADYKTIRPVVQFGDIYRLVSPYDRLGVASLMYTSPEKDKAVFYWWKTEHFVNQHLPRVKMNGLSPDKKYRVCELNRIDNEPLAF